MNIEAESHRQALWQMLHSCCYGHKSGAARLWSVGEDGLASVLKAVAYGESDLQSSMQQLTQVAAKAK